MKDLFFKLTVNQERFIELYQDSSILFLLGPAGTSKTFMAAWCAIDDIVKRRRSRVLLSRTVVEAAGERIGFVPGDVGQKIETYMKPFFSNYEEILEIRNIAGKRAEMLKLVEAVPVGHTRGATYKNCVMVMDEAQNCNFQRLALFIGRLGKNSKMILCGDPSQTDIHDSFFARAADCLEGTKGVSVFRFTEEDNQRHELLPDVMTKINAERLYGQRYGT